MTNIIQDLFLLHNEAELPTTYKEEEASSVDSPITVTAALPPSATTTKGVHFRDWTSTLIYQQFPSDFTLEEREISIWYSQPQLDHIRAQNQVDLQARASDVPEACARLAVGDARSTMDTGDWTWRGFDYALWRVPRTTLRKQHVAAVVTFANKRKNNISGAAANDDVVVAAYALERSDAHGSEARAAKLGRLMEEDALTILGRPLPQCDDDDEEDDEEDDAAEQEDDAAIADDADEAIPLDPVADDMDPVEASARPPLKAHLELESRRLAHHPTQACMNIVFVRKVSKSA